MDIREVDGSFAVAAQIAPGDIAQLHDAGFRTIMCNRPDGESADQAPVDAIRAEAESHGMAFHHIPVAGGIFPQDAVDLFRKVRQESEGPLLAYCRSGTRCMTLETLANPLDLEVEERLERAAQAGYDLEMLRPHL